MERMIPLMLFVLSAAITAVVGTAPAGTVVCTETGFSPTFTKAFEANTYWKVDIGSAGIAGTVGCKGDEKELITGASHASQTIDKTTINAGSAIDYTDCGGTLVNNPVVSGLTTSATTIDFSVTAKVTVRVQGTKISRETYTNILITCSLTKLVADPLSAGVNWVVETATADADTGTPATNTFLFAVELDYYTDTNRAPSNKQVQGWKPKMGEMLYVRIKETTPNPLFHFVVQSCWFTKVDSTTKDGNEDEFFTAGCMVDKEGTINKQQDAKANTEDDFDFEIKAFFFTGAADAAIYLHCQLYICMQSADSDDQCQQKALADCGMNRKRRSITDEHSVVRRSADGPLSNQVKETRIITAEHTLTLPNSEVITPTCGASFIYDRVSKSCSNENLLDVKGVYLDIPWNNEYADTSSQAWKNFKVEKEYQLWALVMMFDTGRQIRGLQVMSATKGSVVLTVRIKYDETVTSSAAQSAFEHAYQRASESRVNKLLNIREEKVIEYIRVGAPVSNGMNIDNLSLIVIVVALCAVVFVSVVAAWKVRSARRAAGAPSVDTKAQDNPSYNMS